MPLFYRMRPLALSLFVLTLVAAFGCDRVDGQSAAGISGPLTMMPQYQSRAPRTCAKVMSPPSVSVAAVLVQCTTENLSAMGVRLVQDVTVQLGAPRAVVMSTDDGLSEIDPKSQVYPMRGSYQSYFCRAINNMVPAATSCLIATVPAGKGWCWKTSFGDWKCRFGEIVMADHYGPAPKVY